MATPILIGAAAGEYMEEVVVVEWAAAEGEVVHKGDRLVTVETAKAATDIEAPCDGILTKIFADAGAEVRLADVLGLVGAHENDLDASRHPAAGVEAGGQKRREEETQANGARPPPSRIIASPVARRAAAAEGIDLARVRPTSPSGRIKLRDVMKAAAMGAASSVPARGPTPSDILDEPGPLNVSRLGRDSGVPVILLHGFGSDSESWFPFDRSLGEARPVIRIDLPSHGKSPKRRITRFELLAGEIVETFDALHLDRAHLVGHSLGGACALALADSRASSLASLTLIAPAGLGPAIGGDIVRGIARASRPRSLAPWLEQMVADKRLITHDFVLAAMSARADPRLRAAQRAMAEELFPDDVQGFDLSAALERLELPARIIWGRRDRVLPWKHALRAPGRVGLHLLANVGHFPSLEAPDTVAAIVESLIRSVGE